LIGVRDAEEYGYQAFAANGLGGPKTVSTCSQPQIHENQIGLMAASGFHGRCLRAYRRANAVAQTRHHVLQVPRMTASASTIIRDAWDSDSE